MRIEQVSLKSLTVGTLLTLGIFSLILSLLAGEHFLVAAQDAQARSLSRALQVATSEVIKKVHTRAVDMGHDLQRRAEFQKHFKVVLQSGDSPAFDALLNDPFVSGFVGVVDVELVKLRVYDIYLNLLAESTDGIELLPRQLHPSLALVANNRAGVERLKAIGSLWSAASGPKYSVLVPIGGLRIFGYLEVVMNPANNLPAVSGIVQMPVVIQDMKGGELFVSPGLDVTDSSLLATHYQLHDDEGHPVFHIIGYENVKGLVAEMNQTRVNLLLGFVIITGIAMLAALWMFSRFLFRPVDTMMRDIARCTEGDMSATVGGRALKEFAALAEAFNLMIEKVNSSIEQLHRLSTLDGLTGLANRRQFDKVLGQEWCRACRNNTVLSVILMDLDYFKLYNDTYGHLAGDDCLRAVSVAFSQVVHRPADLVARYGGEEFIIILPDTPLEGALIIASKIQSEVAELNLKHRSSDVSDIVTLSIGITAYQPKNEDSSPSLLVATADKALYCAKAAGRNRVETQCPENIQGD